MDRKAKEEICRKLLRQLFGDTNQDDDLSLIKLTESELDDAIAKIAHQLEFNRKFDRRMKVEAFIDRATVYIKKNILSILLIVLVVILLIK